MKVRTTIRDVARALGVSHTTVSMALQNDPRILPATRRKVAKAAVRLGYRRDPLISELMLQLRTSRARAEPIPLAFLTAWSTREGWRAGFHHAHFFDGALARAKELGYRMEEFWLKEPGVTARRMTTILRTRGIRGLLVFSLPEPQGRVMLDWRHFAAVTKGLTVVHPVMHRVISSHYDDMCLVVKKLTDRGYRRIGLVMGELVSQRVGHAWLAGYYLHQHSVAAADWVPALFVSNDRGEAQFGDWYGHYRPEVVVFAQQPMRAWVARLGLKVPSELGLVDLIWSPADPTIAGIDADPETLGVAAIDLLVRQLQTHEYGVPKRPKVVEVLGRWVPGKTIR